MSVGLLKMDVHGLEFSNKFLSLFFRELARSDSYVWDRVFFFGFLVLLMVLLVVLFQFFNMRSSGMVGLESWSLVTLPESFLT